MAHAVDRPEPPMMQLLRDVIQADGRSQNRIAKECGMENSRLSRFVRGERDITFSAACRLFDALGIKVIPPSPGAGVAAADEPAPKRKPAAKPAGKRRGK